LILSSYCLAFFLLNFYYDNLRIFFGRSIYYFVYTLLEYGTFISFFYINIKSRSARLAIIIISAFFTFFLFWLDFLIRFKKLDSISIGAETLILLIVAIYFFYEQFRDLSTLYIYHHYCFWLAIGVLIYLCGSFFLFIYGDKITENEKEKFWFFTYIVEIIKNILFAVAMIVYTRQTVAGFKKKDIPYLDIKELQ
jgi:hypothetical protein